MAKRVLYLCNHKTLMQFEIDILKGLGYEVYAPKKPFFDISCGINWELDYSLSIPKEDLDTLNKTDFFYSSFEDDVIEIINKYFSIALVVFVPFTIMELAKTFRGKIVLRAFGLSDNDSYTTVMDMSTNYIYDALEKLGNRFFFASGFRNIIDRECQLLKSRNVYMPLGYAGADKIDDRWYGGNGKVLISCPRIGINSYYYGLYKKIKMNFGDLPYSISGMQPIKVENDPNVVGTLPDGEYEKIFLSHSCFLYPTNEKSHLHYTPFEAIQAGVPLLFMAGGILDELGGLNLPGRCINVKDAKQKAKRLISEDRIFAEEIRKSQPILMNEHTYEYCTQYFQKAMIEIETQANTNKSISTKAKPTKIAIIMPEAYLGGVLDFSLRLAKAIYYGAHEHGDNLEIVFAHLDNSIYENENYFKDLRELGIKIRKFSWEKISYQRVKATYAFSDWVSSRVTEHEYIIPNDQISYFQDCDFILFTVDTFPVASRMPFVPKPYGVIIHDFIARYGLLDDSLYEAMKYRFLFGRNAVCCFTTTEIMREHAIQYAGIKSTNIKQIPLIYDFLFLKDFDKPAKKISNYFLWSTNITPHKNHVTALKGISQYYANNGTLDCFITGFETHRLDVNYVGESASYVKSLREQIEQDHNLKTKVHPLGNLPKKNYLDLLKGAHFFFHPGLYDNGNGTSLDAAFLGRPTLSSDYESMRFINEYAQLNMKFFDAYDPESIRDNLLYMEKNADLYAKKIPNNEQLKKICVSNKTVCTKIYKVIKRNLGWK